MTETAIKDHSLEERLNALTHAAGAGMSIAALVFLLVLIPDGPAGNTARIAFSIYGASQILLYLSSAVTHQFSDKKRVYHIARIFDQLAIYYLIAGTYTPIALLVLPDPWRTQMLISIWGLAALGTLLKGWIFQKQHKITDILYVPMGWLVILFLKPLQQTAPEGFLTLLMAGGIIYTVGIIFYLTRKIYLSHVIWHLFVIAGSICFYAAFARYLI
jgi:hemolysin III